MSDERTQIKDALVKLALGEDDVSGRTLAARVTALRAAERVTRDDADEQGETIEERAARLDYPVGPTGKFDPSGYAELWALDLGWTYQAGDARELRAITMWEVRGGRREWDLAGRPWPRSEWELDCSPWERALTAASVGR